MREEGSMRIVEVIYILHEFLADGSDLLGECGAEHHHLLLVWGHAENFLDITTHICT